MGSDHLSLCTLYHPRRKSQDSGVKVILHKKKRGGQKGNRNAAGHGAPRRNQNAVKHGGYCQVFRDTLTDREREMLERMSTDPEQLLIDEINLLTVQEKRIMEKLRDLGSMSDGQKVCSIVLSGNTGTHDDLPGKPYVQITHTEAAYLICCKLDEALGYCSETKRRYIESLAALQLRRGEYSGRDSHDVEKVKRALENIAKHL